MLRKDRPQQLYRTSHIHDKRSRYFQVNGRYIDNCWILSHYYCGSTSATDSRILRYVIGKSLCENIVEGHIKEHIGYDNFSIVSPDAETLERAVTLVEDLRVFIVLVHKERVSANEISRMLQVGKLKEMQYINLLKI